MIISHKHKFIFIKTRKTAGTSVEIALSEFCGPNDVITPISPKDEKKRAELEYRGAQNYLKYYNEYNIKDWLRILIKLKKAKKFHNHMPALEVRNCISKDQWKEYYKFCFERNPFDKIISYYYWIYRNSKKKESLSDFVGGYRSRLLREKGGWGLYADLNDNILVDKVYQFEHLGEAMEDIKEKLQIENIPNLVHTKNKSREKKHKDYTEVLSQKDITIIKKVFKKEIELFNYKPTHTDKSHL
ncbi:MAG: sulfotransferase family 2 domain-containing protein [Bacteroidia bacterium]|nr:sulfotransferase family 2 domain-containing protein [Bacteroidia bacterium]